MPVLTGFRERLHGKRTGVNSYDREKEFRRVELEAKDWLRAENAQKEKERQLQAKIEEGKEASAGEIGAVLDDNAPTKRMMGAESRMGSPDPG